MKGKKEDTDNRTNIIKRGALEQSISENSLSTGLIIEDNTIYEIDEECMNCLKKREYKK